MASTSYRVTLIVDGANAGEEDAYDVGLEPGHRRRRELTLPEEALPPNEHEVAVRVSTTGEGSAAGPIYTDQCALNDIPPASHVTTVVEGLRGGSVTRPFTGRNLFASAPALDDGRTASVSWKQPTSDIHVAIDHGCEDSFADLTA
jgi:hypothetical protein